MDNITHSLFGAAVAKTWPGRKTPLTSVALVVTANFPDVDIVSALWGRPTYLHYHRGITHSVIGILLQSLLLAGLFFWLEKRLSKKTEQKSNFPVLLLTCAIGLTSHLLLDFLNTYGIRPWIPFSNQWYYGDLAFIVDPYLWLIFSAITFWPKPHSSFGTALFLLFGAGTSWIVWTHPESPMFLRFGFSAALLVLILGRWFVANRIEARNALRWGVLVTFLYLGGLATARTWLSREPAETRAQVLMSPLPARPWEWRRVELSNNSVTWETVSFFSTDQEPTHSRNDWNSPELDSLREDAKYQAWLNFARMPFVVIVSSDKKFAHFLDARYQMFPNTGWAELILPIGP